MNLSKFQFVLLIVIFCIGLSLDSLITLIKNGNDKYPDPQFEPLQCSINIDCDNFTNGKITLKREK